MDEQVVNTVMMLVGAMLWGHVIGTFCGVVATMSPHTTEFNRRMDDLNRFVVLHGLDAELRRRLREYLHQTKHLQVAHASKDLIAMLSPSLQGEVVWKVHKPWLSRVSFFNGAEKEFLVQVALSLSPLVFTPGELAVNGFLYIVHKGIALYGGRVLTSGKVWGEDCIIQSVHLQKRWCARAMNYLEVYMISREDIIEITHSFPKTYEIVRKAAVRMAVRRQFILAAKLLAGGSFSSSKDGSATFDRLLDQATSVPLAEMKLQGALVHNRLDSGPNSAQMKRSAAGFSAEHDSTADGASPDRVSGVVSGSVPGMLSSAGRRSGVAAGRGSPPIASRALAGATPELVRSELNQAVEMLEKRMHSQAAPAAESGVSSTELAELKLEVRQAVDAAKSELAGRIDALSASVAQILERLPATA